MLRFKKRDPRITSVGNDLYHEGEDFGIEKR
jgi:hypothetical protein